MAKPFKFRYVNEVVGTFVLLVLLLLVAGVFVAGKAQGWFEPRYTYFVTFPPAGAEGIQQGAEVRILGTLVGSVDEVLVSDNGVMEGKLIVKGDFRRFIRTDSKAILKKKFQVAGDAYIEITRGESPTLMEERAYIPCSKDTELIEMVFSLVDQLRAEAIPLLDQISLAVTEYTGLATDLRDPTGHVQQLLARVDNLAAEVEQGHGAVGKLLKDPKTAEEIERVVATANEIVVQIQAVLVDVKEMTKDLPETMRRTDAILADVKQVTEQLPQTTEQTQAMLYESQKLIEGIQQHWLIRGYVEPSTYSPRIAPEEVQTGKGGVK
ncbi:MAG: MCE family protein [Spartobacteria bacterium]|nr:MCE family protein [Spartobacteria bacterium]